MAASIESYVSHSLPDFISEFSPKTETGTHRTDAMVAVAGCLKSIRCQVNRRMFYDICADGTELQIMAFHQDFAADAKAFEDFNNTIKRGNVIGARGYPGKSSTGRLSLFPQELVLLSPSLQPLLKVSAAVADHTLNNKSLKKKKSNNTNQGQKTNNGGIKKGRGNKQRKKKELKVNSRATLWASCDEERKKKNEEELKEIEENKRRNEEEKKYSSDRGQTKKKKNSKQRMKQEDAIRNSSDEDVDNGYKNHREGSQAVAKEAWAAARAQIEKYDKEERSVAGNGANKISGEDLYISAKCLSSDHTTRVRIDDKSNTCYPKLRIRDEWKKNDTKDTKTKFEEDMEDLFECMNSTEVGKLSTTEANLTIELSDSKGGFINNKQNQYIADAAFKMMDSWVGQKNWTKEEARLAGQILLRMENEEVLGGGDEVKRRDYLAVINAYSKVTLEDETASIRSENILDHMERRVSEGREDLAPDRLVINTVIGAQAKHSLSGKLSGNSVLAAERMLQNLERAYAQGDDTMQPTARTYSKFIDLYAKNGQPEKAMQTLDRMEYQFNVLGNKAALPRTIHYTSVIDSIARTARSSMSAARTAEKLLRSMLDLYDKGEHVCAPDTIVFSATIDAYAKSGRPDAAERSLAILDLMDAYQVSPDIITYNTLLNTLSKSSNFEYFLKSKDILNYIEQSSFLRADAFTYNAAIKCFPPEEAEKLIQVSRCTSLLRCKLDFTLTNGNCCSIGKWSIFREERE